MQTLIVNLATLHQRDSAPPATIAITTTPCQAIILERVYLVTFSALVFLGAESRVGCEWVTGVTEFMQPFRHM